MLRRDCRLMAEQGAGEDYTRGDLWKGNTARPECGNLPMFEEPVIIEGQEKKRGQRRVYASPKGQNHSSITAPSIPRCVPGVKFHVWT